jgi:hypothetical protein
VSIIYQYQPNGGCPAHEREVFWLSPKDEQHRMALSKLLELLRKSGVSAGWTGMDDEMALIEFKK